MEIIDPVAPGLPITGAAAASNSLSADLDTFLILLTTQLQNQDPLDPVDSSDFTQQLVQFTATEQAITTNKNLETLINLAINQNLASAVGFIGKTITAETNVAQFADGTAEWHYSLQSTAVNSFIEITDSRGGIVLSTQGETEVGDHVFTWDGRNSSGRLQPDGIYKISVTAVSASEQEIPVTTFVKAVVTGVDNLNGVALLAVNGLLVTPEKVLSVLAPKVTQDPPNTTADTI